MVKAQIGGQSIKFLLDTGAAHSVLTQPLGPLAPTRTAVQGATGAPNKLYPWTTRRTVNLGDQTVTHSFLVIPECPYPLLGRDLLRKLGARISFSEETATLHLGAPTEILVTCPISEEYLLQPGDDSDRSQGKELLWDFQAKYPSVWAETNPPGLAVHQTPIMVGLKPTATPIAIKQYPIKPEARKKISLHINRLLDTGILKPCTSPWNTPLLPVPKADTGDYRPVQDLREINKRVETIHPTVPNPYTLLSLLPPEHQVYTVLDLKDAFFSIPLAPISQPLFAFEWTDPERGISGQLTWTRLPQGFKNSPTLFDKALNQDLHTFREQHKEITLLQYVDDLLLAAPDFEACKRATGDLLSALQELGYRVSAKKAQLCSPAVTYLGYDLNQGKRALSARRIQAITHIPTPNTKRQVREFLGAIGYCRLWILGFAELAKPLYSATAGGDTPLAWTPEADAAFHALKQALISAPALALPDITKPFSLFVAVRNGIAKGVLTQTLGPWKRPVAYLSKRLDPIASGWPSCLQAIAATALLVKETDKLTFGQDLTVTAAHGIEALLRGAPSRWLSNARLTQYQALLLDHPRLKFKTETTLNPATLLPDPDLDRPLHHCLEVISQTSFTRPDLTDIPLPEPDETFYTDGSSYVRDGTRYAGAAIVNQAGEIRWAQALPRGSSAQKAELIALTQALRLGRDKAVNIYTDSRYAFATVHVHGEIYKNRGLLTSEGRTIKNKEEILALLEAVWEPNAVAIIHCRGHQKDSSPEAVGNRAADQAAREIAIRPVGPLDILNLKLLQTLPKSPTYATEEHQTFLTQGAQPQRSGWLQTSDGRPCLPQALGRQLITQLHHLTHLGARKLNELIRNKFKVLNLTATVQDIVSRCTACAKVNISSHPRQMGTRFAGAYPGEHWELDFTEVRSSTYNYKYLLVFIDSFSGWVEAYPTRTETAATVAKKLLQELIPRFGLPRYLGSDNSPAFTAAVSQILAKALHISWKLHCAYRPQSSGQVERINRTLKETLTKFVLETGVGWPNLLPLTLLRVRCTPYRAGFTPYEILYGRPPPLLPRIGDDILSEISNNYLIQSLQALQTLQTELQPLIKATHPDNGPIQPHPFQPGDAVLVRRFPARTLEPAWKGPYVVTLITPSALKVAGIPAWIHYTQVKPAPPDAEDRWRILSGPGDTKIRLGRVRDSSSPS